MVAPSSYEKGIFMPEETEKKDVLEFPLEELSIPQAVALMMQAATQCRTVTQVNVDADGVAHPVIRTDDDRLQLLCEKLEGRIQDDLDALSSERTVFSSELVSQDPIEVDISAQIFADGTDADGSKFLNWQGRLFKKMCNERVYTDPDSGEGTFCIKQWDHQSLQHEDWEGNVR